MPQTTVPADPTTTTTTTIPGPIDTGGLTAGLVVDKLTFGPRPGLVDEVAAMGITEWIDAQLQPVVHGVPDAETRVAGFASLTNTNRQNYELALTSGGVDRMLSELDHATILRSVYSERQLQELMVDFWSNHFNTWRNKTWMTFLKSSFHETVIRPNALGRFSDMLLACARHNAMLDYLDNLRSDASAPGGVNENYARELMELHTLGIINGQQVYTEADVRGVARIMSGWSINWADTPDRYNFAFLPWQHSLEAVSILGGTFSRPARTYGQGYSDGVRLLSLLAHHPSTARFISRKLCIRFVGDTPSDALIDSAAAVFLANDTAIGPTLRHIFSSDEFAASGRSKVRRPFEHVVACLRATRANVPNGPLSQASRALRFMISDLGQPLFERQSPDGYPDRNAYWTSSEGLLQRWQASAKVVGNSVTNPSVDDPIVVSLPALLPSPLPSTVADLVGWLASDLGNFTMPPADVARLCASCGLPPTGASTVVTSDPARLRLVFGLVLSHPTFQRR